MRSRALRFGLSNSGCGNVPPLFWAGLLELFLKSAGGTVTGPVHGCCVVIIWIRRAWRSFTRELCFGLVLVLFRDNLGTSLSLAVDVSLPPSAPPTAPRETDETALDETNDRRKNSPRSVKLRTQLDGVVLRFIAKHYTAAGVVECCSLAIGQEKTTNDEPADGETREFTVSFYPANNHLLIHENPNRNSGRVAGRFLQKAKHVNQETGKVFTVDDLYIGATIKVNSFTFEIVDSDLYTEKWLASLGHKASKSSGNAGDAANRPERRSSVNVVLEKLRGGMRQQLLQARESFRKLDEDKNGVITINELRQVLTKFGFSLTEEEELNLMQKFDVTGSGQIGYCEFCDAIEGSNRYGAPPDSSDKENTAAEYSAYAAMTSERCDLLHERSAVLQGVRNIQRVFHQRPRLPSLLLKEFSHMTISRTVTPEQIREAIKRIGYEFDIVDIKRCVQFLCPDSDPDQVDTIGFVQALTQTYYDLPYDR
eukprot:GHVT01080649.1.p1 GENE.GHVT01080649.1~~GHVT01080649.1.p1  ORF type:complete len:481 (+),score=44.20 GHVT01080649.1:2070-3512(+)